MYFIDTHTHLFLPEFDDDRNQVVQKAISSGVAKMIIPNVDTDTLNPLLNLCNHFPDNCFPLIGLHPCSVDNNFESNLSVTENALLNNSVAGIGEIGLDFYWDTTFKEQQIQVFKIQLDWAKKLKLPVAIHVRNSFREVIEIITQLKDSNLTGVFHCFTGNYEDAKEIVALDFFLGIGGIVTFKNSGLDGVLNKIPVEYILLETDSPYLAPVPYRGKRNESSYIPIIAERIAQIYDLPLEAIADITSRNAENLFRISHT